MERVCFNCGIEMSNNNSSHVKKCSGLDTKESRYKQLMYDFKEYDLSESNIKYLYYDKSYSLINFKDEIGLSYKATNFLFEYYLIKKKNKDVIKKEKSLKYSKTCLDKYGFDSSNKMEFVKEKKKNTSLEKYGVSNVYQYKPFIDKAINTKYAKYGKACFTWDNITQTEKDLKIIELHSNLKKWWSTMDVDEKYSRISTLHKNWKVWYYNLTDDEKIKYITSKNNNYQSKLEKRVIDILEINNIDFEIQYWVNRKSYDIKMGKTLLEINGDFWHCNPKYYSSEYIHPILESSANDIWLKDLNKKKDAEKYGYQVIYLWECDINNFSDSEILEFIKNFIG